MKTELYRFMDFENKVICEESFGGDFKTRMEKVYAKAFEVQGLPYVARTYVPDGRPPEIWFDASMHSFACAQVDDDFAKITSPIGDFLLKVRREKPGTAVIDSAGWAGIAPASEVVRVDGRFNSPTQYQPMWRFQISSFEYADGSRSNFLGCSVVAVSKIDNP